MFRTFCFLLLLLTCSYASANIIRPHVNNEPTPVEAALFILDLDSIDTAQQQFEATLLILFKWNDPRLAHSDEAVIRKPLDEVWHPRLQAVNQQKLWPTFPEIVEIHANGDVIYTQ